MSQMKEFKEEPGATLPTSDAERWIAGTYAIWSEYCGGSCKYLGGYEKTKANAKMLAKVLRDDWMVDSHDSGVDMVKYLLENAGSGDDDEEDDEDFEDDEEYDEDDEDFEDDEEYDEDDEDLEDDEEDEEDDEDFEDDEEYEEDDEDFEDDEEYDEDDEDLEDDEEDEEDDEDLEDDEEYDEDDEDEDFEEDDDDDDYEIDTTAFDYACACNMCGRMFIAGYLSREESIRYATEAAKKIQELYSSWEEFFQAYIIGAAGGSNVKDVMPFAAAFQKMLTVPENPLDLDWNTPL